MRSVIEAVREAVSVRPFELLIALRYLTAKRKQAVIAVISLIAILGIAAGVAVLLIALSLVNGFNEDIQGKLLAGTAHLNLLRKDGRAIPAELQEKIARVPGIRAVAPTHYEQVFASHAGHGVGLILKGVDLGAPREANEVWGIVVQGAVERLAEEADGVPGILLGRVIAEELGVKVGDVLTIIPPDGRLTPLGVIPRLGRLRVVGLFSSGLYEYDSSWGYVSLDALRRLLGTEQPATVLQMKVTDIYAVKEIARRVREIAGPEYTTTDWQELNQPVFAALQIQRIVVVVVLTLMIFIAALNIITSLVMMVIEKTRDISILRAMGARSISIMRIFIWQGVLVGVIGTALGLGAGVLLSWLADRYQWIRLPETVFSIAYAPFRPRVGDAAIVAGIALLISFLATIYPARQAARLNPVEGLRYE
ncbi:MAG: ABC transporter permease [Blastocatellia bacterium]|nr:ABC transporter permease [Blastocatellia bacterium]MCS7158448.1 ABC transporter permease [Blastocatellia bacterium]MDW8167871.1 FtsX-like permease family protein [Acidobacteriota bacterium]MDW8255905.1 FtsX-like permease family protein [Acidobacteriota bacterium]